MLEQLFGSKTRVALLKLFFENPENKYYVRELTREIDAQINSVRRELDNLLSIGIVSITDKIETSDDSSVPKGLNKKKYYCLNRAFVLFDELSGLFTKSDLLVEQDMMVKLKEIGSVEFMAMTGFFVGDDDLSTDLIIVGNVKKSKLAEILKQFERKFEREINYTIMTLEEFNYRQEITDRFLYDILMRPKVIVVNKVGLKDKTNEVKLQPKH